jgi:myo-inositol-1(or 4)-monophosphatase
MTEAVTDVEQLALHVAAQVREAVAPHLGHPRARERVGRAPGGDATMAIDAVAEDRLEQLLRDAGDIGFYSEDRGLVTFGRPRAYLVVDPVDGTRPAAAGFESCCVSVAVAPPRADATLGEVSFGVVHEIKTGQRFWAGRGRGGAVETASGARLEPACSGNTDLGRLFWTAGLRGRPSVPLAIVLEELADGCSLGGGYFDLGSATYDLTRIVTGQLDAYVDVGRRIVDEVPATEPAFLAVGEGAVCTNFPYDVAAAALIAAEAGATVTHADGSALDDHPAVGSGRAEGLAVLAAGNPDLHGRLLDAVSRGIARLAEQWPTSGGHHSYTAGGPPAGGHSAGRRAPERPLTDP